MSIRVAIAGVGNCASSLVQGVEYYKDTADDEKIPGLMHNNFGGYRVRDIEFVTAFDVDALKVGKDLSEAIFASQNNTIKFSDVPDLGVEVLRGPTYDGLGEYYRQMIDESDAEPVDVAAVLREKQVDVLVSYLPVGSEQADKAYAQAAMDAGCAFVNCLPVFIASDPEWAQKFRDAGVPIVGRGRADRRRRHQEPGRRHDHPPRDGPSVRGPRRAPGPHLPAQCGWQHGLHEHAAALAAGVQEDFEDPRCHLRGAA